jgi:hypothetical protein
MNRATLELEQHRQRIEAGNASDRLWMEDERLDLINSLLAIAVSHLSIAGEAAFLRDRKVLRDHLGRGIESVKLAGQTHKLLPPDDAGDGEAKTKTETGDAKGGRSGGP